MSSSLTRAATGATVHAKRSKRQPFFQHLPVRLLWAYAIFSVCAVNLGCQKAKELADNAVNKVKEDFKSAKEKLNKSSNTNSSDGNQKKDVTYSKPELNKNPSAPKSGMTLDRFLQIPTRKLRDQDIIALGTDVKVAEGVNEISLAGAPISAKGLEALAKFPNLERLELTRCNATVGNMKLVGQLRTLKALNVSYNPLTDADFAGIRTLTKLEEINFSGTQMTDQGFTCFSQMPNLAIMHMETMSHLLGKGFRYVNKNSLRELYASGTAIGQFAFQSIGGSESLEILWVNSARVPDKAMQGIGRCPNLRDLRAENNDLTDKGTSYLKNHKKLEKVVLARNRLLTNLTLGHLTKTKTLVLVNVHKTRCSHEGGVEFHKYVPDCDVVL